MVELQHPGGSTAAYRQIEALATLAPGAGCRVWQSAPQPDGPLLATACADKVARIYDLRTFELAESVTGGHKRSVRAVAWRPAHAPSSLMPAAAAQGSLVLATGSFDATAGVWTRRQRSRAHEAGGDSQDAGGDSHDASGDSHDAGGKSHDAENGGDSLQHGQDNDDGANVEKTEDMDDEDDDDDDDPWKFAVVLEGHDSEIKSVAWSASGRFLATCSRDKSVWVWEELLPVTQAGAGANRQAVAAVDLLGSRRPRGGYDAAFETAAILTAHTADVKHVVFHPVDETLLASASYDDDIRLYRADADADGDVYGDADGDWACFARLAGHTDTVWCLDWEVPAGHLPPDPGSNLGSDPDSDLSRWRQARAASGPRLASCSADGTVRIWARAPAPAEEQAADAPARQPRLPSILRNPLAFPADEKWVQDAVLPTESPSAADGDADTATGSAIYAVAWSKRSGMIAVVGAEGTILVYSEVWIGLGEDSPTRWKVVAKLEAAHAEYEINHICWARRWDSGRHVNDTSGEKEDGNATEEVLITTGDDGEVKVWTIR